METDSVLVSVAKQICIILLLFKVVLNFGPSTLVEFIWAADIYEYNVDFSEID